jgi:hypothetical protein
MSSCCRGKGLGRSLGLSWTGIVTLAAWALAACGALGQEPAAKSRDASRQVTARYKPATPRSQSAAAEHPLKPVLEYALREQAYLRETLRDFTCRLVKRERINGILQDYNHIDMMVREEIREGERIVQPFSIYLEFLAPPRVAGRRVLYGDGQNDGKMKVRNGGKHFEYVVVDIDPNGESARDESLVPITQSGFNRVLNQMIAVLERHMRADPTGENTKVERIAGARINKRPCTVVRVVHPRKQDGLEFHVANVFVDDELRVPVRVDFSLWPTRPNQTPPLLAEYTYTNLRLNVGIPDSVFTEAYLRARH